MIIEATLKIGAVLVPAVLILSLIVLKATPKDKYAGYFPGFISFMAGLFLLLFATILERTFILGAGLGGWGIACLFAGVISMMITAIVDAYGQPENT